jgi:hypothetical protein
MRFGNGRDGLIVDPGEITGVACSDLGRGNEVPLLKNGSRPAYSQECLPKAQAKGLLSDQGDIKRI